MPRRKASSICRIDSSSSKTQSLHLFHDVSLAHAFWTEQAHLGEPSERTSISSEVRASNSPRTAHATLDSEDQRIHETDEKAHTRMIWLTLRPDLPYEGIASGERFDKWSLYLPRLTYFTALPMFAECVERLTVSLLETEP